MCPPEGGEGTEGTEGREGREGGALPALRSAADAALSRPSLNENGHDLEAVEAVRAELAEARAEIEELKSSVATTPVAAEAADKDSDGINDWYRDAVDQQMARTGSFSARREMVVDAHGGELASTAMLVAMSGPDREAYWRRMEFPGGPTLAQEQLAACPSCHRSFRSAVLDRHQPPCEAKLLAKQAAARAQAQAPGGSSRHHRGDDAIKADAKGRKYIYL